MPRTSWKYLHRQRSERRSLCLYASLPAGIALNHPCHRGVAVNLAIALGLHEALDESAQCPGYLVR
ncbi:MAG: hypothetical protein KME60_26175 [Cyanomargarita calcarea GSE-NOS-MK-12-04C]|uniref:Uncharacterized protein n=1 Tax=Cyanomargarita calcarea GSE-NOS-MK-12-04C TaxID=2839659 RepID=A0A951UY05_9CYAN|nr:hypothetical protein [Cyanomargarita calcarea GSE-NOS-MK-12-04C]